MLLWLLVDLVHCWLLVVACVLLVLWLSSLLSVFSPLATSSSLLLLLLLLLVVAVAVAVVVVAFLFIRLRRRLLNTEPVAKL